MLFRSGCARGDAAWPGTPGWRRARSCRNTAEEEGRNPASVVHPWWWGGSGLPVRGQVVYLPILERVGPVLFCMMPHCVLPCNRQPRASGASGASGGLRGKQGTICNGLARRRATGAVWGASAPHDTPVPVMPRRHARINKKNFQTLTMGICLIFKKYIMIFYKHVK